MYTMDMMSLFCGTCLLFGGTTLNPRNMNTLIRAARSFRSFLKQTNTFSHSSFSSANSNKETKLSREPSGSILVGISTYMVPSTKSVFHSTSFSSLSGHLKLTKRDSEHSAISSKSINSVGLLVSTLSFKELLDDLVDALRLLATDPLEQSDSERLCDVISIFKLETLPLMIPPSALMHRSCWSSSWPILDVVSAVFCSRSFKATSGMIMRPRSQPNT